MIKGTTTSGFTFEIDENKVNDMRVIDAMVETESGNIGGISKLISLIFDRQQKADLYSFCADESVLDDDEAHPGKLGALLVMGAGLGGDAAVFGGLVDGNRRHGQAVLQFYGANAGGFVDHGHS